MSAIVARHEQAIIAAAPEGAPLYPCGHPRTPENTQSVGIGNGDAF